MENKVIHPNRWLIWTIAGIIAVALLTMAYIEFSKGEIDRVAASEILE